MQPSHPLTDQSDGRAVLQGRNGRPLPCSFLPGTVADLGQQVRAVRVPVLEDVGRDLDEEGVQLCLVPVFKSLRAARVKVKKDTLLLIYTHIMYIHISIFMYVHTHTEGSRAAHLGHLVVVHAQDVLHQVIGLADQLHVAVLDAVVDHFHKVPRAFVSDLQRHARPLTTSGNGDGRGARQEALTQSQQGSPVPTLAAML